MSILKFHESWVIGGGVGKQSSVPEVELEPCVVQDGSSHPPSFVSPAPELQVFGYFSFLTKHHVWNNL